MSEPSPESSPESASEPAQDSAPNTAPDLSQEPAQESDVDPATESAGEPAGNPDDKKTHPRRWWYRPAAVTMGLILTLVLTEIILQVLDKPTQLRCGWRLTVPTPEINQLMFRGRKIDYQDDDFVIVMLGDSQLEGISLPFENLPEIELEKHLHALGYPKARVIGLGASGYGQDQQLLVLQEYYDYFKFRADVVLVWETPYNDVWNNIFPTQWMEGSAPKPTFALVNGKLHEPATTIVGQPMLSSFKLLAAGQKLLDPQFKLATTDRAWEQRYLPPAYRSVAPIGRIHDNWQKAYDWNFGVWRYEQFTNEKCNYSLGFTPISPRMKYGLDLTNALLRRIQTLAQRHDAKFAAFRIQTKSHRFFGQEMHLEPRIYAYNRKYYRYSYQQELDNIQAMNQGIKLMHIPCDVEDFRIKNDDGHLNAEANDNAMMNLAKRLIEEKLLPLSQIPPQTKLQTPSQIKQSDPPSGSKPKATGQASGPAPADNQK